MKTALLTALAVILAGCAGSRDVLPTPPAEPIHDHLIVPGQRAGPVSLGMTAAELYRAMGEPLKTEGMFDGAATEFAYAGLAARVNNHAITPQISSMCYADGLALNLRDGLVEGVVVWTPGCP